MSRTVLLGTSRPPVVAAAAAALQEAAGADLVVVAPRGQVHWLQAAGVSTEPFDGRIGLFSGGLLWTLMRLRPARIVVVIGDQFAHENVTAALNGWRALGLLGACEIFLSLSNDPGTLEGFTGADARERLTLSLLIVAAGLFTVMRPWLALLAALCLAVAERLCRVARPNPGRRQVPPTSWPVLVQAPALGWQLRPADVTRWVASPGAPHVAVRLQTAAHASSQPPTTEAEVAPIVLFGGSYLFFAAGAGPDEFAGRLRKASLGIRVENRAVPGYALAQAAVAARLFLREARARVVVVVVDEGEGQRVPAPGWATYAGRTGHARFPLAERSALWRTGADIIDAVSGWRAGMTEPRRLTDACRAQRIPLVFAVAGKTAVPLAANRVADVVSLALGTAEPARAAEALAETLQAVLRTESRA